MGLFFYSVPIIQGTVIGLLNGEKSNVSRTIGQYIFSTEEVDPQYPT